MSREEDLRLLCDASIATLMSARTKAGRQARYALARQIEHLLGCAMLIENRGERIDGALAECVGLARARNHEAMRITLQSVRNELRRLSRDSGTVKP